ncbi:MAG: hypothetical protein AAFV95_21155 [Bacteroidota bacterium]
MTIKHPANFISAIYQLERGYAPSISGSNKSARQLAHIREELRLGRHYKRKRNYDKAISHFRKARALAYQLIHHKTKPDSFVAKPNLRLPEGPSIESQMAEISLKLLEDMQSDLIIKPPVVLGLNFRDTSELLQINKEGITPLVLNGNQLEEELKLGTELLTKGAVDEAISILGTAARRIGTGTDSGIRAALSLNLSSAYLAKGDATKAHTFASLASRQFATAKDNLGRAQALHNLGTAQMRQGKTTQARATLKQSSELFRGNNGTNGTPLPSTPPTSGFNFPLMTMKLQNQPPAVANFQPMLTPIHTAVLPQPMMNFQPVLPPTARPSTQLSKLSFIADQNTSKVSVRWLGQSNAWSGLNLNNIKTPLAKKQKWSVSVATENGNAVSSLAWNPGRAPKASDLFKQFYSRRINALKPESLKWYFDSEASTAVYLTHIYAYVTPVAIADAYHEMGNYQKAESYYITASKYTYLNRRMEATNLWVKMANNYQEWGDELYKDEKVLQARVIYGKVVAQNGVAPSSSPLFKPTNFKTPATAARSMIIRLKLNKKPVGNGAMNNAIYTIWSRWQYILAGLDFYGQSLNPLFTFEYLQQAAKGFAVQAVQAEREYVNFMVQFESESAARRDLESTLTMAKAEEAIQQEHYRAAADDLRAAERALDLATVRRDNAVEDRNNYRSAGAWQYRMQSLTTATGAGADWYESDIRKMAANIEAGEKVKGKRGKLAAAGAYLGGEKSYEYQLDRMANQIQELDATIRVAQSQAQAAGHREKAAQLSYHASRAKADLVEDALTAFDNEVFTPETWAMMALVMRGIAKKYQFWAVRTAKLMERAYNFETDRDLSVIKSSYGLKLGNANDMLGADLLLRDIDSFTYHLITNTNAKDSKIKDVLSLRNEYPMDFYRFQESGLMRVETALHDFDRRHPGFFGQRLSAVEVEVIGLLPSEGVNGTLRGSFVSRYRTENGGSKNRLHLTDTLALSEYTYRGDGILFRMDLQKRGLFEGNGVAGSWELELPRRSNNFDFRLITDVRLVFYYSARFSPSLKTTVLNRAPLPGEMTHARDFALRYDFPEVWYGFLKDKEMSMSVTPNLMPRNEKNFRTKSMSIALLTAEGVSAAGVRISLTLPGKSTVSLTTNANGTIESRSTNGLGRAMKGALLGEWQLSIRPPANSPLLTEDGRLDPSKLLNISIINQYDFDWA